MTAEGLLREGRLDEATERLRDRVREDPTDSRSRTFLFELLCFRGQYDQARKHLEVLGTSGSDALGGTLAYQGVLHAEELRRRMFEEGDLPQPIAEPARLNGTLNGRAFSTLIDSDPRIGPRLEVFAAGDYLWVGFEQIASIRIQQPQRLRDLIWLSARLVLRSPTAQQLPAEVLLPALCPLTFRHPDGPVRLGRLTEWCQDEAGEAYPCGAKVLLADGEEISLLDAREIDFVRQEAARG